MPTIYFAPKDEVKWLLNDVLHSNERTAGMHKWKREDVDGLVDMGAEIAEKVIFPLSAKGDAVGAKADPIMEFIVETPAADLMPAFEKRIRDFLEAQQNDFRKANISVEKKEDGSLRVVCPESSYETMLDDEYFKIRLKGDDKNKPWIKSQRGLGYINVVLPEGFKEAYDAYCESGLLGLLIAEKHGGLEAPHFAAVAINEFMNVNFAAVATQGLSSGGAQTMQLFAEEWLNNQILPDVASGKATITMCLTEPDAGSSMKGVKTKAVKLPKDGDKPQKYAVTGNKHFITSGMQDLIDPVSGNIYHLVLAKLPGHEEVSLFLVPGKKIEDDVKGADNNVRCTKIEEKLGIHGSPTCALSFENSEGYLVGKEGRGLEALFIMMKDERLNVGTQGLSTIELAAQNLASYAGQREQGEHIVETTKAAMSYQAHVKSGQDKKTFKREPFKAVAIGEHDNVKRDLLSMTAEATAWRTLLLETATQLDVSKGKKKQFEALKEDPNASRAEVVKLEKEYKEADAFYEVMTPIIKACITDAGLKAAQRGAQLHGGMGFITETGVHQFYRDAFISTIYEGTNPIQAMDFTFRKGKTLPKTMISTIKEIIKMPLGDEMRDEAGKLSAAFQSAVKNVKRRPMQAFAQAAKQTFKFAGQAVKHYRKGSFFNPESRDHARALRKAMKAFYLTAREFEKKNKAMVEEFKRTGDIEKTKRNVQDILIHSEDFMNMFGKIAAGTMFVRVMEVARKQLEKDPNNEFLKLKMEQGRHFIHTMMGPDVEMHRARIKARTAPVHNVTLRDMTPRAARG